MATAGYLDGSRPQTTPTAPEIADVVERGSAPPGDRSPSHDDRQLGLIAQLLLPPDAVERGPFPGYPDPWRWWCAGEQLIAGMPPLATAAAPDIRRILRHVYEREAPLARRRLPLPGTSGAVSTSARRIPARHLRPGLRSAIRSRVLSGLILEPRIRQHQQRTIDLMAAHVAAVTGSRSPSQWTLRCGSGAAAMAIGRVSPDCGVVLRVTDREDGHRLRRAAEGLQQLEQLGVARVPRLLAQGTLGGLVWSAESLLRGQPPGRLTEPIIAETTWLLTTLRTPTDTPPDIASSLDALATRFPRHRTTCQRLGEWLAHRSSRWPPVVRHGDLWSSNLLVNKEKLTGIVDWDAWRPTGIPGVDLLHLIATDIRHRTHRSLGDVYLDKPWLSRAFCRAARPYWDALGLRPSHRELEELGVIWWLEQVTADFVRSPALAADPRWVRTNVDQVFASLS